MLGGATCPAHRHSITFSHPPAAFGCFFCGLCGLAPLLGLLALPLPLRGSAFVRLGGVR